jgi:hypothetical protein
MDVCSLAPAGATLGQRHLQATPAARLKAMAPDRAPRVRAAEGRLTWSWRADCWAAQRLPVVLGPARSMQAIPGGQATPDTLDAPKLAGRRRGGLRPQASLDPPERRAPRDRRRRRRPRARNRGARRAPGPHTTSPDQLPARGQQRADHTHRAAGAARLTAPAGPKRLEGARALLGAADALRRDGALTRVHTATPQAAHPLERLPTGPGRGTILRRGRRDASPQRDRGPRGPDCAAVGRLGPWAKDAAGNRAGTSGTHLGPAPRPWACAAAAVFCWRDHPAGQHWLARVAKHPRQGTAWTRVAPPVARAVEARCTPKTACARPQGVHGDGSGGGALDAALAAEGRPLPRDALHDTPAGGPARRCAYRALALSPPVA